MHILIVDDNEMVRRGITLLITSRPEWTICGEASSGKEAMVVARISRPDLVVLDVRLPDTNGLEVAAMLRLENPELSIVIVSQHEQSRLLPRALEAGANACVDKSSLATDLLPTIDRLIKTEDS